MLRTTIVAAALLSFTVFVAQPVAAEECYESGPFNPVTGEPMQSVCYEDGYGGECNPSSRSQYIGGVRYYWATSENCGDEGYTCHYDIVYVGSVGGSPRVGAC